jgi:hypothetical protein
MESTIVERYMERWRGSPEYGNVKWMLDQSLEIRDRILSLHGAP